jgi:uncharacterized protein YndB with AHSA1/START domain
MSSADKPVGLTKDAGYQIGVRRTIEVHHTKAWDYVFSTEGMNHWLGPTDGFEMEAGLKFELEDGATGEVRVYKPGSHVRIALQPRHYPRPSTIQLRIIDKEGRTTIAFHQEHLPNSEQRESRRAHFISALDKIESNLINQED